jgi:anthranilate synthase / indole-3-glycerol phosphate synthase / phosphoribosylanthranilate isomerase
MHGKLSSIRHDGRGCFQGLPQRFKSTRYHSLSASLATIPAEIMVTAATVETGVIMGVRHRKYTLEAVQYHPESILSEAGDDLLRNFLALRGGTWDQNPQSLVHDQSLPPFPIEALNVKMQSSELPAKIPTILERIYAQRLKDVELAKSTPGTTPADINTLLALHLAPPLVPLVPRLKGMLPALMAEIKRASPSKGPISLTANAPKQALTYALSGASVISVLTEPTWFKGSLLDMRLVRQVVDTLPNRPAILRKDFILDEYQIAEARLFGADTVLLIVAMLPSARLKALYAYSLSLGMEPLVEVNNSREMTEAFELGAKVIGVNNRNLHNFQVDMSTTTRLADMVRDRDVILCALSGIENANDVRMYTEQGVGAVLVGEALMKAHDTGAFIRNLLGRPEPTPKKRGVPLVKICGIKSEAEAMAAAEAGADMLGIMFVPTSKRMISLQTAQKISSAIHALRLSQPPADAASDLVDDANEPWFSRNASHLSGSPSRPLLVGVFQDQPLDEILHAAAACHLDLIQLHGNEPVEWAKHIPVPVIRVFHVGADGQGLEHVTRPGLHNFVLLDTARGRTAISGGSGETFNWELARRIVDCGEVGTHPSDLFANNKTSDEGPSNEVEPMPIILAGGLNPDNIAEAVARVHPWAVDVSGGVETADGQGKDAAKVIAFIRNAKGGS